MKVEHLHNPAENPTPVTTKKKKKKKNHPGKGRSHSKGTSSKGKMPEVQKRRPGPSLQDRHRMPDNYVDRVTFLRSGGDPEHPRGRPLATRRRSDTLVEEGSSSRQPKRNRSEPRRARGDTPAWWNTAPPVPPKSPRRAVAAREPRRSHTPSPSSRRTSSKEPSFQTEEERSDLLGRHKLDRDVFEAVKRFAPERADEYAKATYPQAWSRFNGDSDPQEEDIHNSHGFGDTSRDVGKGSHAHADTSSSGDDTLRFGALPSRIRKRLDPTFTRNGASTSPSKSTHLSPDEPPPSSTHTSPPPSLHQPSNTFAPQDQAQAQENPNTAQRSPSPPSLRPPTPPPHRPRSPSPPAFHPFQYTTGTNSTPRAYPVCISTTSHTDEPASSPTPAPIPIPASDPDPNTPQSASPPQNTTAPSPPQNTTGTTPPPPLPPPPSSNSSPPSTPSSTITVLHPCACPDSESDDEPYDSNADVSSLDLNAESGPDDTDSERGSGEREVDVEEGENEEDEGEGRTRTRNEDRGSALWRGGLDAWWWNEVVGGGWRRGRW